MLGNTLVHICFLCRAFVLLVPLKAKLPLLLSRMKEVAKVFLATNSDYKYTDVSDSTCFMKMFIKILTFECKYILLLHEAVTVCTCVKSVFVT